MLLPGLMLTAFIVGTGVAAFRAESWPLRLFFAAAYLANAGLLFRVVDPRHPDLFRPSVRYVQPPRTPYQECMSEQLFPLAGRKPPDCTSLRSGSDAWQPGK